MKNILVAVTFMTGAEPREMREVRLAIGSSAASVWWVNSKEVIGIYGDCQAVMTTASPSGSR